MHRCNSTYRLRYWNSFMPLPPSDATWACCNSTYRLRYATKGARQQRSDDEGRTSLVPDRRAGKTIEWKYLPLAVLKRLTHIEGDITSFSCNSTYRLRYWNSLDAFSVRVLKASCNSTYRLRYATKGARHRGAKRRWGPHISSPCLKGRENKGDDGIILTVYGMRRRVRGSRGAKRRWGPHISSPWLKGRENKGDEVTVLTACGIETLLQQ